MLYNDLNKKITDNLELLEADEEEMFLLIKTCHNVADYHRIIKFVIGGMEIVLAECRERH